jgi:raffinose/stachyose/melibiose transport system permease protein
MTESSKGGAARIVSSGGRLLETLEHPSTEPANAEPARAELSRSAGRARRRPRPAISISTLVMLVPAVALFSVLIIVPLIMSVVYSFTNLDSYGAVSSFVGFDNYTHLFLDPNTVRALEVTAVLTLVCTVVINFASVGIAMLLNHRGSMYNVYRSAIFYPYVLSALISGFVWSAILNPDGAMNTILQKIGIAPVPFFTDPNLAVVSLIVVTIWNSMGFSVVLYLAGLQTIPQDLLEAAEVDGATGFQRFRHIIWPLLGPTVTINIVLVSIGLLRTYDLVVSLTGGGPAGQSNTIAYRIIALGFSSDQAGQASAGATVLFLATIALAGTVMLIRRRRSLS